MPTCSCPSSCRLPRLTWIDSMKGISIIWIAFFHCFSVYDTGRYPWPLGLLQFPDYLAGCAGESITGWLNCFTDGIFAELFQRGPHAVGVFLALSGFSLTLGLLNSSPSQRGWPAWYGRRLLRLFPLYWMAHLIYLVSPFIKRTEAIDYRFFLSLLGDRVWPVDTMFFYLNPSWWFFGLLLELYIVFPLLYRLLQRMGPAVFLVLCGIVTILSRYLLLAVFEANGNFIMGAFFGCRLWEFAAGMALAVFFSKKPMETERLLFSWPMLAAGILIYGLGGASYRPGFTYAFTDGLIGTGLFIIVAQASRLFERMAIIGPLLPLAGVYSFGIYLLHQPYVLYFGERLRGQPMTIFVFAGAGLIMIIAAGAMLIESGIKKASNKIFS